MTGIIKMAILLRRHPFQFLFACLIALFLIAAAFAATCYAAFNIVAPSLLIDAISASTGYETTIGKMRANIFTGKCEVENLVIRNPEVFTFSPEDGYDRHLDVMIDAPRVTMEISPLKLLQGEIVVKSFSIWADSVNRVLLRNSVCNLEEFASLITKVLAPDLSDGSMDKVSIYIKNATLYIVSSAESVASEKVDLDFSFDEYDIKDARAAIRRLQDALSKSSAPFLSHCFDEKGDS